MDDATAELFVPRDPTGAQVAAARERGLPEATVERMLAVGFPQWKVALCLGDGYAPNEVILAELDARERLASGPTVREATWEDDERLTELFAHSSERLGEWDVTVERGPNPFAQQRLQEHWYVRLLVDRGVALASSAYSGRSTLVGGRPVSVGWMGGWRVRNGFRRAGFANLLMQTPGPASNVFGMLAYWYMRLENETAAGFIDRALTSRQEADAPERTERLVASVEHFDATGDGARCDARVRPVEPRDLPRCAELINATHEGLDLFRPTSAERLQERLDDLFWGPKPPFVPAVYGWSDHAVLEEAGEIVACAGLWDRGRDVRERWKHRATGVEHVSDGACLLDLGHAPGRADAMAALVGHHLAGTAALGRGALAVPLDFLPEVRRACEALGLRGRTERRRLETMAFSDAGTRVDVHVTRPYTDLAYW